MFGAALESKAWQDPRTLCQSIKESRSPRSDTYKKVQVLFCHGRSRHGLVDTNEYYPVEMDKAWCMNGLFFTQPHDIAQLALTYKAFNIWSNKYSRALRKPFLLVYGAA
ncbi:uncharacterized protein PHALS_04453 [Plasmopara halstedii]|uniref:Uncharacterized protein n=1 Tax=Plasmopara halstedii TaxID=4781 RepID=A0A0N7L3W2_PLAHL|nr:uncharacterized protein PHALS_04453 [Plasmopara halstedii]CEG36987.1 hypothetical protein PHALS_04453 [Plasmopara halstedii]|eukprot:XP_024573356.1 hypothetical protein PHALS_04453 [Plasmopara halstedii]